VLSQASISIDMPAAHALCISAFVESSTMRATYVPVAGSLESSCWTQRVNQCRREWSAGVSGPMPLGSSLTSLCASDSSTAYSQWSDVSTEGNGTHLSDRCLPVIPKEDLRRSMTRRFSDILSESGSCVGLGQHLEEHIFI
jgi:hypothetical protein